MRTEIRIRNCREDDLADLIRIWRQVDLTLGISDTIPELKRMLALNPDTCLVLEHNGRVVAGVMGGFDGRRGLVHHLSVAPEFQRCGYGRALMEELETRFRGMNVVKYSLWIEPRNQSVIDFYNHIGYELRDLITFSKTLRQ